jgi:hypothetical protein
MPECPEGHKRCTLCQQCFPSTTEFFNKAGAVNGLATVCKGCTKALRDGNVVRLCDRPCPEGYRVCTSCWQDKPETSEFFAVNTNNHNLLMRQCRDCLKEHQRRHRHGERHEEYLEQARIKQVMIDKGIKQCTTCKEVFPATTEYFYAKPRGDRGLDSSCISCRRDYNARLSEDPERKRKQKEYDASEKRREAGREYKRRPEAKERAKQKKRSPEYKKQEYEYNHSEKGREARRRYAQSSHGRAVHHAQTLRRRMRKRNLPYNWTTADYKRMMDYWEHRCCACGRPAGFWHTIVIEHWIAMADRRLDNPGTVPTNIVPMCHSTKDGEGSCNNHKSDKDPIEWPTERFGLKKAKQIEKRVQEYFRWVTEQPR